VEINKDSPVLTGDADKRREKVEWFEDGHLTVHERHDLRVRWKKAGAP
jgi:hypothetical protein